MFSAMLLAISILALSQFAIYYWRAVLTGVAAQPVSERVMQAAHLDKRGLTGEDFAKLAELHDLTPLLHAGKGGLGLVRLYYNLVRKLGNFAGNWVPAISEWSAEESLICTRYVAVQVDRRMQANLALAASLRSC
ncbi:MAG: hypothetical protein PVS2B2_04740 [Candidatus Acidiferrum sp.]